MLKDFSYGQFWTRKSGLIERQIITADYYLTRTPEPPTKIEYKRSGIYNDGSFVFTPGTLPYSVKDIIRQTPDKDGKYIASFTHPLDYKFMDESKKQGSVHDFSLNMTTIKSAEAGRVNTVCSHNLYGPSNLYVTREKDNGDNVFPYTYTAAYRIYGEMMFPKDLRAIHMFAEEKNITVSLAALVLQGFKMNPKDSAGCKRLITFFQSVNKVNLFNVQPGSYKTPIVNKAIFDHLVGAGITIPEQLVVNPRVRNDYKLYGYYSAIAFWALDEMKESLIDIG